MLLKPVDGEMATTSVYADYRALLGCKAHKYWLLLFLVFLVVLAAVASLLWRF